MQNIILKERELREKLAEVVNDSGLPAFILKPIVKEMYEQLINIEQQQYEEALESKEKRREKKDGKN